MSDKPNHTARRNEKLTINKLVVSFLQDIAAKIPHATRVPLQCKDSRTRVLLQITRVRFVRSRLDASIPARKLPSQLAPDCPARIPIFGRNFRRCVERDQKIPAATKSSVSPVAAAVPAPN